MPESMKKLNIISWMYGMYRVSVEDMDKNANNITMDVSYQAIDDQGYTQHGRSTN